MVETTQNIMRDDFKDHEQHDHTRFKELHDMIVQFHLDVGKKFDTVNDKLDKQGKSLMMVLGGLILASWLVPLALKILGFVG